MTFQGFTGYQKLIYTFTCAVAVGYLAGLVFAIARFSFPVSLQVAIFSAFAVLYPAWNLVERFEFHKLPTERQDEILRQRAEKRQRRLDADKERERQREIQRRLRLEEKERQQEIRRQQELEKEELRRQTEESKIQEEIARSQNRGYLYVLANESMPGLLKIGKSVNDPNLRAKDLRTTGVPTPFVVKHFVLVFDMHGAEREAHRILANLRVSTKREFFRVELERAIEVVNSLRMFNRR